MLFRFEWSTATRHTELNTTAWRGRCAPQGLRERNGDVRLVPLRLHAGRRDATERSNKQVLVVGPGCGLQVALLTPLVKWTVR
jgi:hypothetical protein